MTDWRPDIGLAVQGGAMSTAFAVGALRQLEEMNIRRRISVAAGVSSGAMAMAAFMTGNAEAAERVFLDVLPSRRFINPVRIWKVVDVDYLIDILSTEVIPDLEAQLAKAPKLYAGVTVLPHGEPRLVRLNAAGCVDRATEVLRASAAIPFLYGRQIELSIGPCVDGGVSSVIPLFDVLAEGPEIVIVISTVPSGGRIDRLTLAERVGLKYIPGIPKVVRRELLSPNVLNRKTELIMREKTFAKSRIVTIAPSDPSLIVYKTSLDRAALKRSAEAGAWEAERALIAEGVC